MGVNSGYESREFRIERESLQALVGADVPREAREESILERLKGKEVKALVYDDRFELLRVRGTIYEEKDKVPGTKTLWIENWQGARLPKRWVIKVLEVQRG